MGAQKCFYWFQFNKRVGQIRRKSYICDETVHKRRESRKQEKITEAAIYFAENSSDGFLFLSL